MLLLRLTALAAALVATLTPARAQIQLPLHLTEGAVVQRNRPMPVWGRAVPGADVRVAFDGATAHTTAGTDGRWRVDLPAHAAGGPFELDVRAGAARRIVRDVLVGDLWIASGQSNMEWSVADARDAETLAVTDRTIRHFKVPTSWAEAPQDTLAGGRWATLAPETVGRFTAVGTFFARALREHTDVPIGILNTTWGGSRIEAWMSADALGLGPAAIDSVFTGEQTRLDALLGRTRARIGPIPTTDVGLVDGVAVWAAPDLDESEWTTLRVPSPWESQGYDGMDGIGWYRTAFDLTAAEAAAGVTLGLGKVDDTDDSYVNGVHVGRTANAWTVARRYAVPASALRAGRNVVAVRVEDTQGGGGIGGEASDVYVEMADGARRSLAGTWRFRIGPVRLLLTGNKNQTPTALWNTMVAPLFPSPVAGVIWYQGESNGDAPGAAAYRDQFQTMIRSWRAGWGEVPFLWVQLANYHDATDDPDPADTWPLLRESQSAALALPNTAQAVIIDVGDAASIHPLDKRTVGERLALPALAMVYGVPNLVTSGPTLRSATASGNTMTLTFDHVGGGLRSRGDVPLGGFALAGADGRWAWADARIEGDRVVVSSPAVPAPVSVRYAWADNPARATLINADGLPASPFRSGPLP